MKFTENCYLKYHFKGVDLFNDNAEMQWKIFGLIFTEICYLKCHFRVLIYLMNMLRARGKFLV